MKNRLPSRLGKWLAVALLAALATASFAAEEGRQESHVDSRKDPTVPPAAWLALQPAVADAAGQAETGGLRARVIVTGKTRRFALIDRQVVRAGDTVGDAKVTAIRESTVIMDDEEKSLAVLPNVEKKRPTRMTAGKRVVRIPEDGASSQQTGGKQ
jgi:hypothetical protein